MATDPLLLGRIQSFLITQRGITDAVSLVDFEISETAGVTAITMWAARLGPMPTAQQLSAVSDAEASLQITKDVQRAAQRGVDAFPIVQRAIILTLIDETNRLRAALRGLGVTGLPDVSTQTAITAVRTKAGTLS